jgi:hypothetical protein
VRQFKAFGQFENRHVRNIRISLVTKNLFQEKYVLEYSSGDCFFVTPNHEHTSVSTKNKGAPPRDGERLCSTRGNVAYGS